jgi:hypothetical protein
MTRTRLDAHLARVLLSAVRRGGPVMSAVVLAMVSAPVVAVALLLPPSAAVLEIDPMTNLPRVEWQTMSPLDAGVLALAATCAAGLTGGYYGGRVVARHRLLAPFLAIAVAWPVAIVVLGIVAAVLHIPLRSPVDCAFGCDSWMGQGDALAGFAAYGRSVVFSIVLWEGVVVSLILMVIARRIGQHLFALCGVVATHAVINGWSILVAPAATIAYACLAIGVVAWATWLRWREERLRSTDASTGQLVLTPSE